MKRTVDRKQTLVPFQCDLGAIEALITKLKEGFGPKPSVSFYTTVRSERLEFDSVEEIRTNSASLPAVLHDLTVYVGSYDDGLHRTCWIRSRDVGESKVTVEVQGPELTWAAGITELVRDFAERNRRWYHWLRPWMLFLMAIGSGLLPSALRETAYAPDGIATSGGYYLLLGVLWSTFFMFGRLFHSMSIITGEHQNWLRRNATEIMALISLLSLVATIIGIILRRK